MKVTIQIEKFDNGITIDWGDSNGRGERKVSYKSDSKRTVGEMILNDVNHIMEESLTDKIIMEIEYKEVEK